VPGTLATMSVNVLVMCTANVCRSPMAEALLGDRLARAAVDAQVASAGFLAGGQPVHPHSVEALAIDHALVIDPDRRSRQVSVAALEAADLVVTMTREHVRRIVELEPRAFERTFALKELVRRATATPPRTAAEDLSAWLRRVSATTTRTPRDLLGSDEVDDVADPIGHPLRAFRATAAELADLAAATARILAPYQRP
jgi:protein-tyrosine phosphatase